MRKRSHIQILTDSKLKSVPDRQMLILPIERFCLQIMRITQPHLTVPSANHQRLRSLRVIMRPVLRTVQFRMQTEVLFEFLLKRKMPDLRSRLLTRSVDRIVQTKILSQL